MRGRTRSAATGDLLDDPDDMEGWQGTIEDGEVTTSHEDAINKEENGDGEAGEEQDREGEGGNGEEDQDREGQGEAGEGDGQGGEEDAERGQEGEQEDGEDDQTVEDDEDSLT